MTRKKRKYQILFEMIIQAYKAEMITEEYARQMIDELNKEYGNDCR